MRNTRIVIVVWISLVLSQVAGSSESRGGDATLELSAEQYKANLASFDYVWQTIRDKHYDPKLGGLDWQAVRDEYRPQMEKAKSMADGRAVLMKMIKRLGQSHFAIIPREVYQEIHKEPAKPAPKEADTKDAPPTRQQENGVPGFDVRVADGGALVIRVEEASPAAKLGVAPGWEVLKTEGVELAPSFAKVQDAAKDSLYLEARLTATVMSRLRGRIGDRVPIVFRNGTGEEVTLEIPFVEPKGKPAQFGNLPPFYVSFEDRTLPGNVGYFRLSAFFDPIRVMQAFEASVKKHLQAGGFILDLRGNPGGIGFMAVGLGNWFVAGGEQKLGTMVTRDAELKFVLNPRLEMFKGPLAVLIDGGSMSTSEILAGGLQDLKRARVFGTPTPGAALPSQFVRLPNGDGFQFAFANYISASGKRLEGNGVRPDEVVRYTRAELLAGRDPVLQAALAWIQAHKSSPVKNTD